MRLKLRRALAFARDRLDFILVMHVCLVTEEYAGLNASATTGSTFRGLAELMVGLGHRVDVLITDLACSGDRFDKPASGPDSPRFLFLADLAAADPDIFFPVGDAAKAYAVYRRLKVADYDCVHFAERMACGYYAAAARRQGGLRAKVITHLTLGSERERTLEMSTPELAEFEREALEKAQIENSDIVVSPDAHALQWLASRGVSLPESVTLVAPRASLAARAAEDGGDAPLATSPLGPGAARELVFCGDHASWSGFQTFVEAARLLPDAAQIDLTFVGRFGRIALEFTGSYALRRLEDYRGRIRFIDAIGADAALTRPGERPQALFVLPAPVESDFCAVSDCFALGAPFIAADGEAIAPLVDAASRQFCLAESGNPARFAEVIARAVIQGLPPLRSTIAPRRVIESWRAFIDRLEAQASEPEAARAEDPFISVCLVHHERPRLARQALDALMAQTYAHFEVVLVDDGSRSAEAIAFLDGVERARHRVPVRVIRSENRYLGAARNLAASHARGEYLLFHDDDNVAEPGELEIFARAARRTGCRILTSQFWVFRASGPTDPARERRIELFSIGIGCLRSLFENRFGDANALVHRETFQALGGFTELHGVGWEDWELFARAWLRGVRMGIVPEPLFNYRVSSSGMLLTGDLARNQERLLAMVAREQQGPWSDLLRYARKQSQDGEMQRRLAAIFERLDGAHLHRELMTLDPGSRAARDRLSDLALELDRIEDAAELARGDAQRFAMLSDLAARGRDRRSRGKSTPVVVTPGAEAGEPVVVLRGWCVARRGRAHALRTVSIDGVIFNAIAQVGAAREDVARQFGGDVRSNHGFTVALRPGRRGMLQLSRKALGVTGPQRIEALEWPGVRMLGHVDETRSYQHVKIAPPAGDRSGAVVVTTVKPSVVFARAGSADFVAASSGPQLRSRLHYDPASRREIGFLIPADGETSIAFE